ncbi:c-type cytochrome [Roseibium salinum]|uniref:Cytochrome C552 n=1 Tax=Roseibium salinum TaxID=1604349 RepID=A0ABT3R7R1_9HYPH|nr:cytochrome C552 [Roseibium sp. DSM 29163]MCX2725077.1 cytochrome C552 [Roseibium sp. DSM 29163]
MNSVPSKVNTAPGWKMLRLQVAVAGLYLAAGTAAAHAGDPAAGKVLALRWCAACHLVAEDQERVALVALPSFYDIAESPGWTEEALATFLVDPHPKMPDMSLRNVEIANLAAYITSLSPEGDGDSK